MFSLNQDEFGQASFYKEYACFNFPNFPIYPPGVANLCSLFPRAHASLSTLFGLKTNVKQDGRWGRVLDLPYWSQNNRQRWDSRARTADLKVGWVWQVIQVPY